MFIFSLDYARILIVAATIYRNLCSSGRMQVTDGSGGLMVCEWNETLSELQESGRVKVHLSPELQSASGVLPSTPLFSCPLYLPKRASWQMPLSPNEADNCTTSKVRSQSLIYAPILRSLVFVLVVLLKVYLPFVIQFRHRLLGSIHLLNLEVCRKFFLVLLL